MILSILFVCLIIGTLFGLDVSLSQAKATKTPKAAPAAGNAYDVISLVNQVRASNGLAPLQANGSLMAAAQAHSDYQASVGSVTHSGQGGSDVKSRAIASGYGGGAAVSVTENIYGGMNASPQQAVSWWQGDGLHLNTMLSSKAVDVGAGIASGGGIVYYTLDVGYVSGQSDPGNSSGAGSPGGVSTPASSNPPSAPPATNSFTPIQIATPGSDGSIIHQVEPGQTLWAIAASYKVNLDEINQINGFNESTVIYPGQKILVRGAEYLEVTPPTDVPTVRVVPLSTTTIIPTIAATDTDLAFIDNEGQEISTAPVLSLSSTQKNRSAVDPLLYVIVALIFGGVALLIVGNVLRQKG